MNYLAHAYLSQHDPELLLGNFIADHLRGNDFSRYSEGVVKGIKMHREIDHFTDSHPLFKASKRLFYEEYARYSGILVDIYYDHLLARNFSQHHNSSLEDFSTDVYMIYNRNRTIMPQGSSRFLDYVIRNNIYLSYASLGGIESVLSHLSQRIGHGVALHGSLKSFLATEQELSRLFDSFVIDLKREFEPDLKA
ncbi:MAG TPA: ACP phosphodiesterase [Bacteroidia bacterium]|nr:ACP phosphodiesterase [Bacteroidia bacterium]